MKRIFTWLTPVALLLSPLASMNIFAETNASPTQESLLIVGAHPDDETIYCAGLIQQALAKGSKVSVVTLTNGDADKAAAAIMRNRPEADLVSADYIELARQRQLQEVAAMGALGLRAESVHFLGYPDGGLLQVADTPASATPYTQALTGKTSTYGPSLKDFHTASTGVAAPYNHDNALGDLHALIQKLQPTQVFTHPERDWHPDHQTAFRLVREALQQARYSGKAFTFMREQQQGGQFGSGSNGATLRLTLSDREMAQKQSALREHVYQLKVAPLILTELPKTEAFAEMNLSRP